MKETTIAIVGAGASGLMSLNLLVRKLAARMPSRRRIRIFLFDKSGMFGAGVAYSTPLNSHLLNMRADTMSAVPENPHHFMEWLQANARLIQTEFPDLQIAPGAYPPRKLYGRYLVHIFHETVEQAKQAGTRIEFIKGEITDMRMDGHRTEVILADGKTFETDFLILALGNFPPTLLQELRGSRGYLPYPWPVQAILDTVRPSHPVGILGAGLSAIDTLFSLIENGHTEKIYFISRTGCLPKVQGVPADHLLRHVTPGAIEEQQKGRKTLPLDTVGKLFVKELEAAEGKKIDWLRVMAPAEGALRTLEADITKARSGSIPSQAALMATKTIIGDIWRWLSVDDRQRFDCEYKSLWSTYRHPMPVINAEKILTALRSGQLDVLPGFRCARYEEGRRVFRIDLQTQLRPIYSLYLPYVINATGQGIHVARFEDPLIRNLLARGIIVAHPNGGIRVDFDSSAVIHGDGACTGRLFALGELTRGVHFFTNAISENMKCADRITEKIARHISGNP